jgi:hypothetical protein
MSRVDRGAELWCGHCWRRLGVAGVPWSEAEDDLARSEDRDHVLSRIGGAFAKHVPLARVEPKRDLG